MSGLARLGRRSLLRVLALGAPGLLLFGREPDAAERALELAASQLVPDRRSAEVIGVAYLRAEPEEAQRARRGSLCCEGLGGCGGLSRALPRAEAPDELVDAFRARIRRDFRDGDVVWVRGFLLARSEARLCAWIALG